MLAKKKLYMQWIGILLLSAFTYSNASFSFVQKEVIEVEEEERVELEETEVDSFESCQKGDYGFNIIPLLDSPAALPEDFNLNQFSIEPCSDEIIPHSSNAIYISEHRFYILYHNLKLDCC